MVYVTVVDGRCLFLSPALALDLLSFINDHVRFDIDHHFFFEFFCRLLRVRVLVVILCYRVIFLYNSIDLIDIHLKVESLQAFTHLRTGCSSIWTDSFATNVAFRD